MSQFSAIDLAELPPPDVVEVLSFETILAENLADLRARDPAFDALVESDPAYKILEVAAYRELLLRQRVNDASRAVMLAYATGADLDQIGALYGVRRLVTVRNNDRLILSGPLSPNVTGSLLPAGVDPLYGIVEWSTDGGRFPPGGAGLWAYVAFDGVYRIRVHDGGILQDDQWTSADFYPGDPPSLDGLDWSPGHATGGASGLPQTAIILAPPETITEDDTAFRRRIQLALEGFSVAGPEGAYIFWGLSASADVLDIGATSPEPGEVLITVLSRFGDGTANIGLLNEVEFKLDDDRIRPLTDLVTVQSAEIIGFDISAEIYTLPGPDSSLILDAANKALDAYLASRRRIGYDISISGIFAALHQPGVHRVNLIGPTEDISVTSTEAAYCGSRSISIAVSSYE